MRTIGLAVSLLSWAVACGGVSARDRDEAAGGSGIDSGAGGNASAGKAGAASGTGATAATGSGGTPTEMPPAADPLDDMDNPVSPGSSSFVWAQGVGNWFVSTDESTYDAPIHDIEPPRGESTRACHVVGTDFEHGLDLWAQLAHPSNSAVDLGEYTGITFWARLQSPSSKLRVAFGLSGQYVDSDAPMLALEVSEEWENFVVSFEDLAIDSSQISSIDFIAGEGGEPFDLWIDDLGLLR